MEANFTFIGQAAVYNTSSTKNTPKYSFFRYSSIFILLFCGYFAQSQNIFINAISDANPSSTNPYVSGQLHDANITVSGISRGPGITPNAGSNRFNAANWNTSATIDLNDYFEFTLTPNANYKINFTAFVYTSQRSATGANSFAFRSSVDGFTANIGTPTSTGATLSLSGASYQNVTSAITFRFYGFAASGASGTFSINDFSFTGSVVAVPITALNVGPISAGTSFNGICVGTTVGPNSFNFSGTNLNGTAVTVGPLTGYSFSAVAAGPYTSSITFNNGGGAGYSYTGGNLTTTSTVIFVRFTPPAIGIYSGNIPISGGGATAVSVAVSGDGVRTAPSLTDGTVSGITSSDATISATITDYGCTALTSYGIEYSTTPGFANGTGTAVPSSNLAANDFSSALSGLTGATTYYFHTYARNFTGAAGITYGAEGSFTTISPSPLITVPATGAGSLNGFGNICINGQGGPNSFSISGSTLNGTPITIDALSGFSFATSAAGPYFPSLTLVNGGSGYSYTGGVLNASIYVRFNPTAVQSYNGNIPITGGGAPAVNVAAAGSGVNTVATLITQNAILINTQGATIPSRIFSTGCGILSDYGIEYSTTPGFAPGTGIQVPSTNISGSDYSVVLNGLLAGTVYYYYAYANTSAGIAYGSINSFLTADVPTKLVITGISPASPTVNSPFSITIQAQDNLGNPVNVTSTTDIVLSKTAGTGTFIFPNDPLPAGTIPQGGNTIVISDIYYDIAQVGVGIAGTPTTGMTGLGISNNFTFTTIAYTGPTTFTWDGNGGVGSAWLTATNWVGDVTFPGASGSVVNNHLATFDVTGGISTGLGIGINMNSVTGNIFNIGTIYFAETFNYPGSGASTLLGNSSTTASGTLRIHGSTKNTVGGISGNNFTNLLLANYSSNATTKTIQFQNGTGSGNKEMPMVFPTAGTGYLVAGPTNGININVPITSAQNLVFTGGGTFNFTPVDANGAIVNNSLTGTMTIGYGTFITGNTGALNVITPNAVTLGSSSFAGVPGVYAGILRLNGNNITVGGLNTAGTAGSANIVDNGNATATFGVRVSAGANIFSGAFKDGTVGNLSVVKTGAGSLILTGASTATGTFTINGGTLQLNRTGGATLASTASITVSGASSILRVSSDQTIKDLSIFSGAIVQVDAGVTLTITGNYSYSTGFLDNKGTIIMQGSTFQYFPGVTVTSMNNLTIDAPSGVNMDKSLNIAGILTLTSGTFTISDVNYASNTLTINNPIAGTPTNLASNNTSNLVIAGNVANVNVPSSVNTLFNLTVSNTIGTSILGNVNIGGTLLITTAGTVNAGTNTVNGVGNLTMTNGTFTLAKTNATVPELTGAYSLTAGTVVLNGAGSQTVRPANYFNLTFQGTGVRNFPAGIVAIKSVLNINSGINTYAFDNANTVEFNGSNQTIPGILASASSTGATYNNLTLTNTGSKSLGGNTDVEGVVELKNNGQLVIGGFDLTLKSTSSKTATIAAIPSGSGITYNAAGRTIVERYYKALRSWRLATAPLSANNTTNVSIFDTWQNGGVYASGKGTFVTGPNPTGSAGNGLDYSGQNNYSLKSFVSNAYVNIANTKTTNIASTAISAANNAYFLFVRGDRNRTPDNTIYGVKNTTTISARGKLQTGTQTFTVNNAINAFTLIGNPYASPVNFNLVTKNAVFAKRFVVYDPNLGSQGLFVVMEDFDNDGYYTPTTNPTSSQDNYIQSGQAFFVQPDNTGSAATLVFNETNKSTTVSQNFFRPVGSSNPALRLSLYQLNDDGTNAYADGAYAQFDDQFSNGVDINDALKFSNVTENLALERNGQTLAVERRPLVNDNDTLFLKLNKTTNRAYEFILDAAHLDAGNRVGFLEDRFLRTKERLQLNASNTIRFEINATAGSNAADRFRIVFKPTVKFSSIQAQLQKEDVLVNWTIAQETTIDHYEIERSLDGQSFATVGTVVSQGESDVPVAYQFLDLKPAPGVWHYRVKGINADGIVHTSEAVKVKIMNRGNGMYVFPNPVKQNKIGLQFNAIPLGIYSVQLTNASGQIVYTSRINHNGSNTSYSLQPAGKLSNSTYWLTITNAAGVSNTLKVLVAE